MIEVQTERLEIAARVLTPTSIQMIRKAPFNWVGWTIADRWAMNSPKALKALEAEGTVMLYTRILKQQRIEQEVLDRNAPQLATSMTPMEILHENEVQTELVMPQPA